MKKKIYFIFLLIVVGLFGCNIGEGTETEEEIVMTNEQVIIARKLGMSTNYEELSNADKNKLERVEELLNYLEEKYGKEFVFEDYDGGGLLYNEELKVHPEDDRDCQVTLTISNATGKYRDNYAWLYYEDMYCNMVLDFIGDTLNNYNVKIYVDYAEINPEKIGMDLEKDEVKIHANLIIFINGTYDENEAVELTQEFIEWQKLRGFSGSSSLCVINRNSEWINISEYNYDVYIREKANLTVDFLLSKEGEVKIEIRGE